MDRNYKRWQHESSQDLNRKQNYLVSFMESCPDLFLFFPFFNLLFSPYVYVQMFMYKSNYKITLSPNLLLQRDDCELRERGPEEGRAEPDRHQYRGRGAALPLPLRGADLRQHAGRQRRHAGRRRRDRWRQWPVCEGAHQGGSGTHDPVCQGTGRCGVRCGIA